MEVRDEKSTGIYDVRQIAREAESRLGKVLAIRVVVDSESDGPQARLKLEIDKQVAGLVRTVCVSIPFSIARRYRWEGEAIGVCRMLFANMEAESISGELG